MGCNSSLTSEEIEQRKEEEEREKNNKDEENDGKDKKNEKKDKGNEKKDKENEKNKGKKNNKEDDKKLKINKLNKKGKGEMLSTEDNKSQSNVNTEGFTSETRKLNMKKESYEGVLLMQGIEECIPEDLNEDEIYDLVEDALSNNIMKDGEKDSPGKITKKQAKAIASILYNKINKDGKKNKKKSDEKDYPELKGLNVKVGVEKFSKDVIRNVMFQNKKVDDCQIDLTYANLTKDNSDIKALTIEFLP